MTTRTSIGGLLPRQDTGPAITCLTGRASRPAVTASHWSPTIPRAMNRDACRSIGDAIRTASREERDVGTETPRPTRILLVDDDPAMQGMVGNYLEDHNMRVISATRRQEVTRQFAIAEPSLVILDFKLGDEGGLDVLCEIRANSDVPVIIVTGHRHDDTDRVIGLELGADDWMIKPFSLRELLARIRALLRRRDSARAAGQRDPGRGRYRFGDWQLDRRTRRLTHLSGSPVALTKGEYALLTAFLDAPQRPLPREHLLQATRVHEDVFDRSIDVQVLRLRRKLEPDPSMPRIIQTVRGVGYVLSLPVEAL